MCCGSRIIVDCCELFAEEAPRRLQVPHLGCLQASVEMRGGAEILFYVSVCVRAWVCADVCYYVALENFAGNIILLLHCILHLRKLCFVFQI